MYRGDTVMDVVIAPAGPLRGTLSAPPDKAICQRAALIASLAGQETVIRPWPEADDCQRSLALIQALGASVGRSGDAVTVRGCGRAGLRAPTDALPCGESGTTLRLAAGLLAGQPFTATLAAGAALSRRPMRRVAEPLTQMGATFEGASGSGADVELHPPLTVHGRRPLAAIRYTMPVASAQVKSAILLAGLFAEGATTVVEPVATRDHTERMLRRFGILVSREGAAVSLEPGMLTSPGILELPGDSSSAAFFAVAAACVPGSQLTVRGVGLNPTRTAWLTLLERMGASVHATVEDEAWEPRGTVVVEARALRGVIVEAREAPGLIDELPILMVAAACASGITRFEGVGELRVKETDRIESMVGGLRRLGVPVRVDGSQAVEITGGPLTGGVVESAGDHRTAMSLAVAALAARGRSTIRGAECVSKSFPAFFDALRQLAGSTTVKTVDKT